MTSCLKNGVDEPVRKAVQIKPYHLRFTPEECEDIRYYADHLLPEGSHYTGEVECR